MEAMTIRESSSYAMTRVHNSLKKVAVFLVYLCHVDPAVHRLNQSRSVVRDIDHSPYLSNFFIQF